MYRRLLKRAFDLATTTASLLLLGPAMLLIAVAIRLEDRGPAIFRQQRVGKDGNLFTLFKFRSMPTHAAQLPSARAGGLRVTRVGRVLRRTNLDELPQLFNVLRGEMSLVGPRPALPAQDRILRLRRENGSMSCYPGLTGLAQINSYDGMNDEQKTTWDGRYHHRLSFATDLAIIFKTFGYLLKPPPTY